MFKTEKKTRERKKQAKINPDIILLFFFAEPLRGAMI